MIVAFQLQGSRYEDRSSRTDLIDRKGLHATCDKELVRPRSKKQKLRRGTAPFRIPPAGWLEEEVNSFRSPAFARKGGGAWSHRWWMTPLQRTIYVANVKPAAAFTCLVWETLICPRDSIVTR